MTSVDLESVRNQVAILRYVKEKQSELKELEDRARTAIEEMMGTADVGMLDDEPAIHWTTFKSRRLNQQYLKTRFPEVFEECREVSESRRFTVA
jgi:predicted phage-related endonuclease